MKKPHWTPQEDRALVCLIAEKVPWDEMKAHLPGRTEAACKCRFLALRRIYRNDNIPGISQETFLRAVIEAEQRRNPHKWTEEEQDIIEWAALEGIKPKQIIEHLPGRTLESLSVRVTMARNFPIRNAQHIDRQKKMPCLSCHQEFNSRSRGERICQRCKGSQNWRDGFGMDGPYYSARTGMAGKGGVS